MLIANSASLSIVLGLTLATTTTHAQTFEVIPRPLGTDSGRPQSISSDGQWVTGFMSYNNNQYSGFRWSQASGRIDFGYPSPGESQLFTMSISDNGEIVAGQAGRNGPIRAFRQTGTGPIELLPTLPGHQRHYGRAMSGNGSVIVGYSEFGSNSMSNGQAWRWTETGGTQSLGVMRPGTNFSIANAVSNDGRVIVGRSDLGNIGEAFRWSEASGFEPLAFLNDNVQIRAGEAHAASADGSIVVGFSKIGEPVPGVSYSRATRWDAQGTVHNLGSLAAYRHSSARETNADGTVIGGIVQNPLDPSQPFQQAMVWTEATGMVFLSDYLASFGVSAPDGYYFQSLEGISGDGRTFTGVVLSDSAPSLIYVATIPTPASILLFPLAAAAFRRRRCAPNLSATLGADHDNDGQVTDADLAEFLIDFAEEQE